MDFILKNALLNEDEENTDETEVGEIDEMGDEIETDKEDDEFN